MRKWVQSLVRVKMVMKEMSTDDGLFDLSVVCFPPFVSGSDCYV